KSKAMDLLLTARMMGAAEAESAGLVSRVVPADKLLDEALAAAETINGFSAPSVALIKELVNLAYQVPLTDGVAVERRYFHALFGSHDQREGMEAFLAKRAPNFEHR
ncbi:MAG: enoyl-CoA hydratase-related protein, partial [Roseateles sp.]